MNSPNIRFIEVEGDFDPEHLKGFICVYQEAFARAPYNETYTEQEVEQDVWLPHLKDGCIVLALDGNQVVGLGCAMPAHKWNHDEEFQGFIKANQDQLPFDPKNICLMTEVAVLTSHCQRGIGRRLVQNRIAWAKRQNMPQYLMRTAAKGSNSIRMYLKLGGKIIEGLVQDVSAHAKEVQSESKERIYIYGEVT